MSETKRMDIGFSGGAVTATRVDAGGFDELRKALSSGEGWHEISSDDGTLLLNLSQIVFLRIEGEIASIGFGGG